MDREISVTLSARDRLSATLETVNRNLLGIKDYKFDGMKDFFNQSSEAAALLGERVLQVGKNMQQSGSMAMDGGKRILSFLGGFVSKAAEVEDGLADVNKVANLDSSGMVLLDSAVEKMSLKIPVAREGLLQIAAAAGQVGVSGVDNINRFTELTAKISTAWDMAADKTGDSMATLANVYNIPFDSQGLVQLERLGDAVNSLSDTTAAKAPDIVEVMNRIGGVAKENGFGLARDQTAALSAAFLSFGMGPERSATAINAMLKTLQMATKGSKEMQNALAYLGMDAKQLEKDIKENASGALVDFMGRVAKLDNMDRPKVLTDVFGRGFSDEIAVVTGNIDKFSSTLALANDATSSAGSVQREFEIRSATTNNSLILLKNTISVLSVSIGNAMLPALERVIDVFKPLIISVVDFVKEHPKLTAFTVLFTALSGAAIVAGGALLWFFGTAVSGIGALVTLYGWLGKLPMIFGVAKGAVMAFGSVIWGLASSTLTALFSCLVAVSVGVWSFTAALLANPITWVVIGVGALIGGLYLLYQNFESVRSVFGAVWQFISNGVGFLYAQFSFLLTPITLIADNWGLVKSAFSSAYDFIASGVDRLFSGIKRLYDLSIGFLKSIGKAVGLVDEANNGLSTPVNRQGINPMQPIGITTIDRFISQPVGGFKPEMLFGQNAKNEERRSAFPTGSYSDFVDGRKKKKAAKKIDQRLISLVDGQIPVLLEVEYEQKNKSRMAGVGGFSSGGAKIASTADVVPNSSLNNKQSGSNSVRIENISVNVANTNEGDYKAIAEKIVKAIKNELGDVVYG